AGTWKGIVKTYREDITLTFSIADSGDVHAKLGSQLATILNDAKFDNQRLRGGMSGDLGVEEDTGPERWRVSFTHSSSNEDYEPFKRFDFLGFPEKVHADYNGGQVSLRQKLNDSLTAQV